VTLLIADPILGRGGRYAAATQNLPPPKVIYPTCIQRPRMDPVRISQKCSVLGN